MYYTIINVGIVLSKITTYESALYEKVRKQEKEQGVQISEEISVPLAPNVQDSFGQITPRKKF